MSLIILFLQAVVEVFVEEQGFVEEFDEIDPIAAHIVAYDGNEPIGTCRLFYDDERKSYILGRLAIRKKYRGQEIGSLLIKEAEKKVDENGGTRIILHSQCAAAGFYAKNGYREFGEIDDDEGCPHIWMKKDLMLI
jgi:predicted GNAT family N-acyltransferase